MTNAILMLVTAIALATLLATTVHSLYLPKRLYPTTVAETIDTKKRPFCNAFTGCGRKRSSLPSLVGDLQKQQGQGAGSASVIGQRRPVMEESIGSLLELSAEPAVEDISRQIMSEAKLWEAIQEANVELSKAKQNAIDGEGCAGQECLV